MMFDNIDAAAERALTTADPVLRQAWRNFRDWTDKCVSWPRTPKDARRADKYLAIPGFTDLLKDILRHYTPSKFCASEDNICFGYCYWLLLVDGRSDDLLAQYAQRIYDAARHRDLIPMLDRLPWRDGDRPSDLQRTLRRYFDEPPIKHHPTRVFIRNLGLDWNVEEIWTVSVHLFDERIIAGMHAQTKSGEKLAERAVRLPFLHPSGYDFSRSSYPLITLNMIYPQSIYSADYFSVKMIGIQDDVSLRWQPATNDLYIDCDNRILQYKISKRDWPAIHDIYAFPEFVGKIETVLGNRFDREMIEVTGDGFDRNSDPRPAFVRWIKGSSSGPSFLQRFFRK